MFNGASASAYNEQVMQKSKAAIEKMKSLQRQLGIQHTSNPSLERITVAFKKRFGMVTCVTFRFKESGVFVHVGTGKGGQQKRTPKEWFTPVLIELADELQGIAADRMVNASYQSLNL